MPEICKSPIFTGLAGCDQTLKRVDGIMIDVKGTSYTKLQAVTESVMHLAIASATTANRTSTVVPIWGYTRTTPDPSNSTSNLGKQSRDLDSAPAMNVNMKVSVCDFLNMHDLEGIEFQMKLYTTDGLQLMTKKSDGTYKGFSATMATRKDIPSDGDSQQNFNVDVFFSDVNEFKNMAVFNPEYNFSDLLDFVPVGLDLDVITDYSTGTGVIVVSVIERCTETGEAGCVIADFEVLSSTGLPAPVTVAAFTENGGGSYDLTIENGTPAALSAGENFTIQASKDDATYITHLSNPLKQTAA